MISGTRLRECSLYSARFPELRLVFADACEAYTGLRANTPFGGMQEGNIIFFYQLPSPATLAPSGPGYFLLSNCLIVYYHR